MSDAADPAMTAALAGCARRAAADGRLDTAVLLAEAAAAACPSPEAAIELAIIRALCGRTGDACKALDQDLSRFSDGAMWVKVRLALLHASEGRYAAAEELLAPILREHPGQGIIRYFLASCLAHLARFDEANALFARGTLITCGDGRRTSARMVRFPPRAGDGSASVPVHRKIELPSGPGPDVDVIYFVACDPRYFNLFARALCHSLAARSGLRCALHVHLINPDATAEQDAVRLQETSAVPLRVSKESAALDELGPTQRRTYYACARFLMLPELYRHYNRPIIVADIDQLIIRSLGPLISDTASCDVALLRFDVNALNVLAFISATFLVVNPTPGGLRFINTVHDTLAERMTDPAAFGWHLDQAALAVACLYHRDLKVHQLPPSMLDSSADLHGANRIPPETALIWSITASMSQNLAKLSLPTFLDMLGGGSARCSESRADAKPPGLSAAPSDAKVSQ